MPKKEIYFSIIFTLTLVVVFFLSTWGISTESGVGFFFNVLMVLFYALCGISAFSIPVVPLYIRWKLQENGRLTKVLSRTLNVTGLGLLVLFVSYAFLTFLLPFIADYSAVCSGIYHETTVCWAGLPMSNAVWFTLLFCFIGLGGLSLPYFTLFAIHRIHDLFGKKTLPAQTPDKKNI